MREIGIMQGRLLPRYLNRYQAFPKSYWQAEFYIAKELGFSAVEFILDYNDANENPLLRQEGIEEIKKTIQASGIKVKSICADYFMHAPFHSEHQVTSEKIFELLLQNAAQLGIVDIVIPCVDQSKLTSATDIKKLVSSITKLLPIAEKNNIFINFETDLAPKSFKELLGYFNSKNIKVNYDIGNSSSLGYDPQEEFDAYGEYISDLHVKDRILGGGSVKLGTGNAQFDKVFKCLKDQGFKGNITLQASRAEKFVDEYQHVKSQLEYTKNYVEKYLSGM